MLRLLFIIVLALPSILVEAVRFGREHRRQGTRKKGIEQSRTYVPSWATPEGSSSGTEHR